MTYEEILKKAIKKAEQNGFDITLVGDVQPYEDYLDAKYIIFSHHFAKAFFPTTDGHGFHKENAWKYHLQQMVLEEEPLEYIEKFL